MNAGPTPAVAVRGLTCRYPDTPAPALRDVDCTLAPGSLLVVMGASGAGKSTLARCLTRIVPAFVHADVEGDVRLVGVPIAGRRVGELAGVVGMVFQDFEAQLFSTDVTQEVVFALEHTGVPPAEMGDRVRRALAAVGLAGFEGRDPTTLSGGEKQRLAIAGLLALRPPVMVLDEPTTDLDPEGRHTLWKVIAALRAEGLALVVIEHDVEAARDADELLLLQEGRVAARGRPRDILADVERCAASGVRPPDVCRVFAALGLPDPPGDPIEAASRLRAAGLVPAAPAPAAAPPRRPGPPLVEVRNLSHRYASGRQALADVTLDVGAGEFIAVVGRNGSGKTTLVKHFNGLLAPTAGTVRLGGRPVGEYALEDIAQRVGYVFQDPDHQLFAATVAEEVAFGPRHLGLPADEVRRRVAEALAATDLTAHDADPFLLDKGDRQRLAVAAVLALHPELLVLDEPTTGLDWPEQQRMLALLRRLHGEGRTIVIVTHTPWVIAEHAERVLLLQDGRLRYDGGPRGFFADDALVAAAAFRRPEVTRLGRALGCTPLSVEELLAWLRPAGPWR